MNANRQRYILAGVLGLTLCAANGYAAVYSGKVVDAATKKPLAGALVTMQEKVVTADANGVFQIDGNGDRIGVRAYGYGRDTIMLNNVKSAVQEIQLRSIKPKALYLSFYGIGYGGIRKPALKLIEDTELNSLVIDIKGDKGMLPYKSQIPLAGSIGALKITTVKDMKGMVDELRGKGIYTIARIVVFKDNLLAEARPELAIKKGGNTWRDNEGLAWCDPFRKEVWEYNLKIAEEAAQLGFDEIQFDYIRFPDKPGLSFSMPNTEQNRTQAITGFVDEARKRLVRYNVFLSADIFGYACWNTNDTDIGQKLEDLAKKLDYISPMLYPSGFQFGIPGYRNPVANPNEIVRLSLEKAQQRTGLPAERFRPWIQAFKDYAFDRRHFGAKEIRDQIKGSENFGGWMLWNPRNSYVEDGLKKKEKMAAKTLDVIKINN